MHLDLSLEKIFLKKRNFTLFIGKYYVISSDIKLKETIKNYQHLLIPKHLSYFLGALKELVLVEYAIIELKC